MWTHAYTSKPASQLAKPANKQAITIHTEHCSKKKIYETKRARECKKESVNQCCMFVQSHVDVDLCCRSKAKQSKQNIYARCCFGFEKIFVPNESSRLRWCFNINLKICSEVFFYIHSVWIIHRFVTILVCVYSLLFSFFLIVANQKSKSCLFNCSRHWLSNLRFQFQCVPFFSVIMPIVKLIVVQERILWYTKYNVFCQLFFLHFELFCKEI